MNKKIDWRTATEAEMRDTEEPHPHNLIDLGRFVRSMVKRPHDYGTCVYAMSLAATATFNYVAHCLGVTGFQASCADMDILRRTRNYNHGFMIIDANDLLYPQYDIPDKVAKWIRESQLELSKEARKLIAEHPNGIDCHPDVFAHWQRLARLERKP